MKKLNVWIVTGLIVSLAAVVLAKTTLPTKHPPSLPASDANPAPKPKVVSRWERQEIVRTFYALIEQGKTDPKGAYAKYNEFRGKLKVQEFTEADKPFSKHVPMMLNMLKEFLQSVRPKPVADAVTEAQAKAAAKKKSAAEKAKAIFLLPPSDDVIYVIDRSGSMIDTFDEVWRGMIKSFGSLMASEAPAPGNRKRFGVILFAQKKPQAVKEGKLLTLTDGNFLKALDYLNNVIAVGQTDPLPALKLAFETHFAALNKAKPRIQQIVLLTDGRFPDNKAVLDLVKKECERNPAVNVCTILYGNKPPVAVKVMKKITSYSVGTYRFVERADD
jgi:Mg-chelatase subunit ChlD